MRLLNIFAINFAIFFGATSFSVDSSDSEEIKENLETFFKVNNKIRNTQDEFSSIKKANYARRNDKEIDSQSEVSDNANHDEVSTTKTIEDFSKGKNFNWIPYESSMGSEYLPVNTVIAGYDINRSDLYVIRIYDVNEESFKVGKYSAINKYASILDGSIERKLNSFEILQSKNYEWSDDIHNKEDAIIAGHDSNGINIYVCRALLQIVLRHKGFKTSWTPGELRSDGICAIGFNGKIEEFTNFQILKNIKEAESFEMGIDYVDGSFNLDPESNKTFNYFLAIYKQEKASTSTMKTMTARTEYTTFQPNTYNWIPWYEKATDIPDDAVLGGRDIDGSLLYVIRIGRNDKHLYGKFAIKRQNAYVINEIEEFGVITFELLTAEKYSWCTKGIQNNLNKLPICRVNLMESVTPGFLLPNGMCRIGSKWKSYEYENYEILKINVDC